MGTKTTSPDDKGLQDESTKRLQDAFDHLSETEGLNPFTMQESDDIRQLNTINPPDDVFKVLSALLQTLDQAQQQVSSDQQHQTQDPDHNEAER